MKMQHFRPTLEIAFGSEVADTEPKYRKFIKFRQHVLVERQQTC